MDKADTYFLILQIFASTATILATLFTTLTILVINRVKYESAHIVLLKYVSYCGLIFRLFFPWELVFTLDFAQSSYVKIGRVPFCMGETILLNLLCWGCFYTVWYRKQFDMVRYMFHAWVLTGIFSVGIIISLLLPVLIDQNMFPQYIDVFGFARNISLLINIVLVVLIFYRVNNSISPKTITKKDIAIRTLTYRLVFFPIIQIFSRSANIWNYAEFGFYESPAEGNDEYFACAVYLCFCTFLASFGYFLIFLYMQPTAMTHFQALLLPCTRNMKPNDVMIEQDNSLTQQQSTLPEEQKNELEQQRVEEEEEGEEEEGRSRLTSASVKEELESLAGRNTFTDFREDAVLYAILNDDTMDMQYDYDSAVV